MRNLNFTRNLTPASVIANKTQRFGNTGVKNNQGTTRIIYDALLIDNTTITEKTFNFFRNCSTRQFPFTNLKQNQLQVGEALAVERLHFGILEVNKGDGVIMALKSFDEYTAPDLSGLYKSDFELKQVNSITVKDMPLSGMFSIFNKSSRFRGNDVYEFLTDLVLQPLLEFELNLKTPRIAFPAEAEVDYYLYCAIEGTAAILNPRANF